MDVDITIPKPKNISYEQAATLGVGAEVGEILLYQFPSLPFHTSPSF
jgi:NADPH:quinone reductase-like Zn-dependent oxidoreductase